MPERPKALLFVNEDKQNLNKVGNTGPWWKPAMQIFSEISTWIAVPIILALIGGKALDNRYGTKPWLLLACAGIAFLVSSFGIVRSVKEYAARMKKEEKN